MKKVLIYTDGACSGNPGPGGWAAILHLAGTNYRKEICGGFRLTTNNRMEIIAALEALSLLKEACEVDLYTDSQYLSDAVEKGWLLNWQRRSFIKKHNKPVPNADLWKRLLPLLERHHTRMVWIRGHSGHPENERCDQLARVFTAQKDLPADIPYENLTAGLASGTDQSFLE